MDNTKYQCEDCNLIFTGLGDMTLCLECEGKMHEVYNNMNNETKIKLKEEWDERFNKEE